MEVKIPWSNSEKSLHRWKTAALLLIFTLLTVGMTWPLALYMRHSVAGFVGDNFYFVWLIDWYKQAIFDLQSPFFVPFLNYPEGFHLAYNDITPAMALIALPFSLVGGSVFGYNMSIFISFILSAYGAYLLVYRWSKNTTAGIIAGIIFAFAPYRLAHMWGHLNLMGTQWLPFYFLTFYELLRETKISWKSIGKPALFLGLIAFTSQYYLYMTLLISFIILIFYVFFERIRLFKDAIFWKKLGLFSGAAFPLVLFALLPYLLLFYQQQLTPHAIGDVSYWSASPTDFFIPSPYHFILGKWVRQHFDVSRWIESTIYIGITALILAVIALIKHKQILHDRIIIRILAYTCIIIFILALGTNLYWMSKPVAINASLFSHGDSPPGNRIIVPLPGYLLFKYLPFYNRMRVWMRYGIFINLIIGILAGFGSIWLFSKIKYRWKALAVVVLIGLILGEFFQGAPKLSKVKGRPVDYWLALQTKPGTVAELPFESLLNPEQPYYTLIHKKNYIGAMGQAYSPPQLKRIAPLLKHFPCEEGLAVLRQLGVRYILIDQRKYKDISSVVNELLRLGIPLKKHIGNHYVFELIAKRKS